MGALFQKLPEMSLAASVAALITFQAIHEGCSLKELSYVGDEELQRWQGYSLAKGLENPENLMRKTDKMVRFNRQN